MDKDRSHMTERLLNLALELICLLAGEDCIVVKKSGEYMTTGNHWPCVSEERLSKTQNLIKVTSPHSSNENDDQKILKLTNKIIQLLTGEVPIRCEDVAVYLSMEEWQYVEEHQDLYEDVIMENQEAVKSLGLSEASNKVDSVNLVDSDLYSPTTENFHIKDDFVSCEEVNLSDADLFTPTDHASYISAYSKDGSVSGEDLDFTDTDIYSPTHRAHYTSTLLIKEESISDEEDLVTDTEMYTPRKEPPYPSIPHTDPTGRIMNPSESQHFIINSIDQHGNIDVHEEPPSIICSECGECFLTDAMLVLHQGIHMGKKIHSCPDCGMCFSNSTYLSNHLKTHTGSELYACVECGKRFTNNADCLKHQNAHTVRKPYICNVCGKFFSNNSNRVRHQKIHTGEKPFSCSECGKSFRRKTHLTIHSRVHTGEKPFSCPECGKCFSCSAHLTAHRRIHRREAIFLL